MDRILPLGTVVRLKGMADGMSMMITGYFPLEKNIQKLFEFSGVLYPQGFIGEKSIFLFNSEDVEGIVFEGYSDKEGEEFREVLSMLMGEIV